MSMAFLFTLGQALAPIPALPAGTEVSVTAEDLLSVYLAGIVSDGQLVFYGPDAEQAGPPLQPGLPVRIFIRAPDGNGGLLLLQGAVGRGGADIIVAALPGVDGPYSFRAWLQEHSGITLVLPEN